MTDASMFPSCPTCLLLLVRSHGQPCRRHESRGPNKVHASDSAKFVAFVLTWPVLGGRPGLGPAPGVSEEGIDLELLDRWASGDRDVYTSQRGPNPGTGARHAVRFVLALWDDRRPWKSGPFDLFPALVAWDDDQRRVFAAWCAHPWRP